LAAVPQGPVLKVIGVPGRRSLSLAEIESLPLMQFTLHGDPAGVDGLYTGVRLVELLHLLGLENSHKVVFRAEDNYNVILTLEKQEGLEQCLFATRFEGGPIAPDGRGPFRLIWAHNAEGVGVGTASSAKWIWNIASIRGKK